MTVENIRLKKFVMLTNKHCNQCYNLKDNSQLIYKRFSIFVVD